VGKPDPEPFREATLRFALPAAAIVAVEDCATGVRSAKEAGLHVVGYSPEGKALMACDRLIAQLSEIPLMFQA
jgi:beta-phosphoglucomutase-like phosphatase (HAD superfamily)